MPVFHITIYIFQRIYITIQEQTSVSAYVSTSQFYCSVFFY